MLRSLTIIAASVLLSGCIARTAVDVVTAPVRAGSQVVDWTTTSQDEADRARGRQMREREETLGRLERRRANAAEDCADGDREACADAVRYADQISDLMQATPR